MILLTDVIKGGCLIRFDLAPNINSALLICRRQLVGGMVEIYCMVVLDMGNIVAKVQRWVNSRKANLTQCRGIVIHVKRRGAWITLYWSGQKNWLFGRQTYRLPFVEVQSQACHRILALMLVTAIIYWSIRLLF